MVSEQEQAWIKGLRQGDADCYRHMVEAQIGPLLMVARRYLGEDDARDAVQETFIKVHGSIQSFRGEASMKTWVQRILINLCIGKLRVKKRRAEVPIDDLLPAYLDDGHRAEPASPWPEALSHVIKRERLCDLVEENIQKLPISYKTVLIMRDIDGLSGRETAELLELSVGAVKVRLHRARQALKTLLDPVMRGEAFEL